jgi:mono/diheme cytochrome c family protein
MKFSQTVSLWLAFAWTIAGAIGCQREARDVAIGKIPAGTKVRPVADVQPAKAKSVEPSVVIDAKSFANRVQPFFQQHCIKCHGAETAEGELRLDNLAADFLHRPAADHWVEVLDRLNLGEMPPEDEERPTAEQLTRITDWITSELTQARARSQASDGRVLLRRMTRLEYANTVRDLLQVQFVEGEGPLEQLPPDGSIAGFDRVSKALLVDPSLMEAYLAVAQQVVDQAIVFRPPAVPQRTLRYEFDDTVFNGAISYQLRQRAFEVDGPFMVVMESSARTFGKLRHPYSNKEIPLTGRYRVRVRAAADAGERGEPIFMDVTYGAEGRQARFRVEATKDAPQVYEFEKTFDAFTPGEFEVGIVNGTRFNEGNAEWYERQNELTRLAESGDNLAATRIKARMRAEGEYAENVRGSYLPRVLHPEKLPKLYLDWIEVVGPLQGDYPPASMARIFGEGDALSHFTASGASRETLLDDARNIFARLLPRAFRRPVRKTEVEQLVSLLDAELAAGAEPQQALKTAVVAMLCSPEFLFLFEPSPVDGAPRRLSDFELATRLSYFLWSTMPDDELLRLARDQKLREPATLAAQVDRLLADAKSEGFVDGFARQWLKVDEISRFAPDQQIYPDYYATDMAGIDADVKAEPLSFFREVLRRDEPVASFLDSDWLMLNERLAKLYGIDGVTGDELRRVQLARDEAAADAHRRRGGLLGMAGTHLWGADGNRTKPV